MIAFNFILSIFAIWVFCVLIFLSAVVHIKLFIIHKRMSNKYKALTTALKGLLSTSVFILALLAVIWNLDN